MIALPDGFERHPAPIRNDIYKMENVYIFRR